MALRAEIYRAELSVADMDRHVFEQHTLTLARHPSETEGRMMVRLLAFALHSDVSLGFGRGLSTEGEPDLWKRDDTGAIELWIDVGQPDEKQVRKACGRARQVFIYSFSGHSADVWWAQAGKGLEAAKNLTVINLPAPVSPALAKMAQRSMKLQYTIQDRQVWVSDGKDTVHIELQPFRGPS